MWARLFLGIRLLSRLGLADITKIGSETIELEDRDGRLSKVARFTVELTKTKNFDALVGDSLK